MTPACCLRRSCVAGAGPGGCPPSGRHLNWLRCRRVARPPSSGAAPGVGDCLSLNPRSPAFACRRPERHGNSPRDQKGHTAKNPAVPPAPCEALSDHLIKAACDTTKNQFIGGVLGGYLGKLMPGPTSPDAGARGIAPHDALGLRFRHTDVDACLVAVGAFYQTRRKPLSLPL